MRGQILVVEDNLALAENLAELFEEDDLLVHMCARGADALERARTHGLDVAIVDLGLPDGSGVDLASALRGVVPDSEVLLITGDATLATAIAAVRAGVFAYVQKPFKTEDLIALAERALTQVQLLRERTRLAEDLAVSERLYRGIVESADELIVVVDGGGAIHMWNRFATATTGFSQEEVYGANFVERFISADHRAQCRSYLEQARAGLRVPEAECHVLCRDETSRVVRWNLTVLTPESERETLFLLVGADVTDRLALEKRAADAEAMASLATLTAGLAHEIRNPLNAALLQIELLSRIAGRVSDPARDRLMECTRLVQSEIQRLSRLLEDFLSLARPRRLAHAPVDLSVLCEHVVSMHRPVAESAGLKLSLQLADCLPKVLGDQPRLTQVLINLVVNAIDAMRPIGHGEIVLTAESAGPERVRVTVADQGPGIAPEVVDKIFTPFVSTKERGTGLGLSIVKRIIDLHNGTVALRPRPGGGAIAEVVLRAA